MVQQIWCARGDLVEVFNTGLTQKQIIERAQKHLELFIAPEDPKHKLRLPTATEQAYINLRYHMMDHCNHCGGSQLHKSSACTILAVPCQYEHGPRVVHEPHSIICCPSLHALCNICRIRGHVREIHGRNWKSAGELHQIFLESVQKALWRALRGILYYIKYYIKNLFLIMMITFKIDLWYLGSFASLGGGGVNLSCVCAFSRQALLG
jgi:hypothetical protein